MSGTEVGFCFAYIYMQCTLPHCLQGIKLIFSEWFLSALKTVKAVYFLKIYYLFFFRFPFFRKSKLLKKFEKVHFPMFTAFSIFSLNFFFLAIVSFFNWMNALPIWSLADFRFPSIKFYLKAFLSYSMIFQKSLHHYAKWFHLFEFKDLNK